MLLLVAAAGCTGLKEPPPHAAAQMAPLTLEPSAAGPNPGRAVAAETAQSETKEAATLALAPPPATLRQPATNTGKTIENEALAAAPAPLNSQSAAKAAPPPTKASQTPFAAAPALAQPRTPPHVVRQAEPALDVAALKTRLRDTSAIGLFTKLALKNQVDDLMQQFRAHYLSTPNTSVAALRQPYDMLVLKVLALIQDSDPSLAKSISGSREAIWGILADPVKFSAAN
jgi:hypothetical protein